VILDRMNYESAELTVGAEPDVRTLAAACRAEFTDFATLDPVPLDYLHVTLQGVGVTDEVDRAAIDQLVTTVQDRSAALQAFDVTIGPLTGSSGAVRLAVVPYAPLRAVQTMIRSAAADTPGIPPSRTQPKPFTPRASIAYSNAPSPAEPIIDRVRLHRQLRPVTARIHAVKLVELRRENRQYRWNDIQTVPLSAIGKPH
jgi:2'-5' RNA ligase